MGFNPSEFVFGTPSKQFSSYNKQQQGGYNDIFNMLSQMQGGGDITKNQNYMQGSQFFQDMFNDPNFFNKFEAPALRQFQEQTTPDIANRFAGAGTGGSLNSTGFRNAMLRESQNLAQNLAQQRGQMQMQAVPQMLQYAQQPFSNMANLYNIGLNQGVNNMYQPASPGLVQNAAYGAGQAAGKYAFGGM